MPVLGVAGTPSTEQRWRTGHGSSIHERCLRRTARCADASSSTFGVVCQKIALRYASAVQVTMFGCFTGTAACLPVAGQLLSRFDAPYNPRGHNLRRSRPARHGDQGARRMITGTVDLVREDY
jgi:hypothetical protein